MAANQSFLINWSQYLAARALAGTIQCFDVEENLATAASFGSLFHSLNRKRSARAEANIAASFPELTPEEVRDIAKRSMQHMFQLFLVEAIMSPRLITTGTWSQYARLHNVQPLIDLVLRGQPAIFITGHSGNWEVLGSVMASIGYPLVALARPIDNPLINDWLLGIREAQGTKVITKWGATPILQDTLRSGGRLGFIADQNAGDDGLFVPFFGRLASNYKSIGLLAMRYNVPIVVGHAIRLGSHFQYEVAMVDLIQPDDWADQPDPLFYVTARYNRAMEQSVCAAPEQYLWLHRRWKSRPKFEREGQPMPSRLIEKLEQLPWMTPEELARISQSPPIVA